MKHIRSIITIAVVAVIAGIVVWNIMWMHEVKRTSNAQQLRGEAEQIDEATDNTYRDKATVTEHKKDVDVVEAISDPKNQPQAEQREEPQKEIGKPEETDVKPAGSRPDIAIPVQEEVKEKIAEEYPREETDWERENQQLQSESNKVKNITIKGSPQIRTAKQPVVNVPSPTMHSTNPAAHPTSTAP